MMGNKVHKLNGFVYVMSIKEKTESEEWYDFFKREVILTNDPNLKEVQQLTKEEVDYCNSVDEVEVKKVNFEVDMGLGEECIETISCYKLIIPTQEEESKETLEGVADLYSTDEKNCHPADSYIYKKGFLEGAKWQAKQYPKDIHWDRFMVSEYAKYILEAHKESMLELKTTIDNFNKAFITAYIDEIHKQFLANL